jgi:hypothetical protein
MKLVLINFIGIFVFIFNFYFCINFPEIIKQYSFWLINLKASVTFCRSLSTNDTGYEYWDPEEEQSESSASSGLNTPPPEEPVEDHLYSLTTGSFGETLELDDTSVMGNILSKVLEDTFSMGGQPPPNYSGNGAEEALRHVTGPSVWDAPLRRTPEEVYYSDSREDLPRQSTYEPVCEPISPPGRDCVTEYDTQALRKALADLEKKNKQLQDENSALRESVFSMANHLRREAWKRRKLACEALTARFCLNIADRLVKQRNELLRMATRNYANLAYLTHRYSVEEEIQKKADAFTDILKNSAAL